MQNKINQPSCKINPDIKTIKDHKTRQVEQIAQEHVENIGKLTFKNSCFP